jgi:antitoxin component of RelBE/YafQ-DinJ toxin-antitoxin module
MQTKLTLRLDDHLISQAKSYAEQAGKSVSQIVAEYFKLLTSERTTPPQPSTPITQSLRGLLKGARLDEEDYKKHLEEKHL